MKSLKYMLSAVGVMAVLASCGRKESFMHESFVTFGTSSVAVTEDVGTVSIPVQVYNAGSEEVTVTVKATDGTAKNGTNYEIVDPVSGVLTFAPGQSEKNVVVLVKNIKDRFTGDLSFSMSLASATDGIVEGRIDNLTFTINDNDHPLAKFIGTWTGSITGRRASYSMNVTIEGVDGDETYSKLKISNLEPYFASNGLTAATGYNVFTGVVNEGRTQITISAKQPTGLEDEEYSAPVYVAEYSNLGDIVITLNGNDLQLSAFGSFVDSPDGKTYIYEGYPNGCTLTKKK